MVNVDEDRKREKRNIYHREWYQKNKDTVKGYCKKWQNKNKEHIRDYQKRYFLELKEKVFRYYCGKKLRCMCECGCNNANHILFLSLYRKGSRIRIGDTDESFGRLRQESIQKYRWIIKNNFPSDFQVLCHNCNHGKRINNGICIRIQDNTDE